MSGQSAALSKEEACKIQKAIQLNGSHANNNGSGHISTSKKQSTK